MAAGAGGVRLSFTFEGEAQVERTLQRFSDAVADASPAFDAIGDLIAASEKKQFRSEGMWGSNGWVPLSSAYATWKARHYPGQPILRRTGALERSVTRRPFGIDVVRPDSGVFGTGLDYAPHHQRGDGHNPRRPVLDLPETVRRDMVKVLQRWIVSGRV